MRLAIVPPSQLLKEQLRRKELDVGGGQFNGQRQTIQARTQLRYCYGVVLGQPEGGLDHLGPFDKEANGGDVDQ